MDLDLYILRSRCLPGPALWPLELPAPFVAADSAHGPEGRVCFVSVSTSVFLQATWRHSCHARSADAEEGLREEERAEGR